MLQSIKQLTGDRLGALDGEIGHITDFYFEDQHWGVRYVVTDTGTWLTGRQVLISPRSLGRLAPSGKVLLVNLTRKQIENSPLIESHKPVSRQFEEEYHRYYGWPYYWQGDALWGMSGVPVLALPMEPTPDEHVAAKASSSTGSDVHLRSIKAVTGYHLQARDGKIGHVCDFMMDDQTWAIGQLVIKTGHRFSGHEVQIPTKNIGHISYDESTVFADLTMEAVEQSPAHYISAVKESP